MGAILKEPRRLPAAAASPQLFGPPPKAAPTHSANDAAPRPTGPLPSILELLERHVAARPTVKRRRRRPRDPCGARRRRGPGRGGGAAGTAGRRLWGADVPRYARDALRAPPTAEGGSGRARAPAGRPAAAPRRRRRPRGSGGWRLRRHPGSREALRDGLAPPNVITWENGRLVVRDRRGCTELVPRYFTVKTGTAAFTSAAPARLLRAGRRREDLAYVHPGVVKVEDLAAARKDEPARKKPKAAEAVDFSGGAPPRRREAHCGGGKSCGRRAGRGRAVIHTAEAVRRAGCPSTPLLGKLGDQGVCLPGGTRHANGRDARG